MPRYTSTVSVNRSTCFFKLNKSTAIVVDDESLLPAARYLQKQLLSQNKIALAIQAKAKSPHIRLSLSKRPEQNRISWR
ncbi:hypothetical protein LWM68_17785 [Niabella sp. W65]|nr:hypothetical protein [Niabella sp. W65]MCH7364437.1 hypothetical protein [Niabella sp. W65]